MKSRPSSAISMWAVSAQHAFWAPVGEYSPTRSDNVGLGYWSHDVRGTVSYFPLGNPGLLLSASLEASYWFVPGKFGAMARVTQELQVRDRFQGTTYTVGINVPLKLRGL